MTIEDIFKLRDLGEVTKVQFKERIVDVYDVACELVALSNTRGGQLVIGINDKTGQLNSLSYQEVQETTNLLANMASENVIPAILLDVETVEAEGGSVIVAHVKEGLNKPYHDNKGIIWVKNGADKRKVFDNAIHLLPYTGAGSGIPRAMEAKPHVTFLSDDSRHEFIITVRSSDEKEHQVTDEEHQVTDEEHQVTDEEHQVTVKEHQVDNETPKVSHKGRKKVEGKQQDIVNFCSVPRTAKEILDRVGIKNNFRARQRYIIPLIEAGVLEMTNPDNPTAWNQKYRKKSINK